MPSKYTICKWDSFNFEIWEREHVPPHPQRRLWLYEKWNSTAKCVLIKSRWKSRDWFFRINDENFSAPKEQTVWNRRDMKPIFRNKRTPVIAFYLSATANSATFMYSQRISSTDHKAMALIHNHTPYMNSPPLVSPALRNAAVWVLFSEYLTRLQLPAAFAHPKEGCTEWWRPEPRHLLSLLVLHPRHRNHLVLLLPAAEH